MRIFKYCSRKVFSCNTFFVVNDDNSSICIDPGDYNKEFIDFIDENNLNVSAILLTHGHFDHIRGIVNLLDKFGDLPIYINENDYNLLFNDSLNGNDELYGEKFNHLSKNYNNIVLLHDDEKISLNGHQIDCIYTPFHTKGCTCFYFEDLNTLFSGDTLFKNSAGRTDLPTSCARYMKDSLNKLLSLPEETKILPGHDESTTLKNEKIYNFFLKR